LCQIIADLGEVLNTLSPKEVEVRTIHDNWYNMRILPYRTMDNRIDGAVLTFADIGDQKITQATMESAGRMMELTLERVRHAFDMNPDPIAVLDRQGRIDHCEHATVRTVWHRPKQSQRYGLSEPAWHLSTTIELKSELAAAIRKGKGFSTRLVELKSPEGSQHSLSMAGLSRAAMTTPIAFFCIL
jgi:PAS domain-containing protein